MPRLDLNAQRRLERCLALAKRGSTPGERAAAKAAAERIAAAASLTLTQAQGHATAAQATASSSSARAPTRARPQANPRPPAKARTVADRLREKAEELAQQRKRAAEADRRLEKERAVQEAWEAEVRAAQAVRDRAWAQSRSASTQTAAMQATLSAARYARHCAVHCSR